MHGQRIGYVRVSSLDQNPQRQLQGVPLDRLFCDKASGRDTRRPQLENLPAFLRQDDTLVVHSMDRLARNLDDLRRDLRIEFLKDAAPSISPFIASREGVCEACCADLLGLLRY